eukprot:sb/3472499/
MEKTKESDLKTGKLINRNSETETKRQKQKLRDILLTDHASLNIQFWTHSSFTTLEWLDIYRYKFMTGYKKLQKGKISTRYQKRLLIIAVTTLLVLAVIVIGTEIWEMERDRKMGDEWEVGSKQPIISRYLGHVTGYQPIRDHHFLLQQLGEMLSRFVAVAKTILP